MTTEAFQRAQSREQKIWPAFMYSAAFNAAQVAERSQIYGLYSGAYLNLHNYLQDIEATSLADMLANYNMLVAGLDTDETILLNAIVAKRYLASIDVLIHDQKLATRELKRQADEAEWDAKREALSTDRAALVTLATKLAAEEKKTAARIVELQALITVEETALSLAEIEKIEKEIQLSKEDLMILRSAIEIEKIQIAIVQEGIETIETELRKQRLKLDIAQLESQIARTTKLEADLDVAIAQVAADMAELAGAEAQVRVETAEWSLLETQKAVETARLQVSEADANIERAELTVLDARISTERTDVEIAKSQVVLARSELLNTQAQGVIEKAELSTLQANHELVKAEKTVLAAQVEAERAKLATLLAELTAIEKREAVIEAEIAHQATLAMHIETMGTKKRELIALQTEEKTRKLEEQITRNEISNDYKTSLVDLGMQNVEASQTVSEKETDGHQTVAQAHVLSAWSMMTANIAAATKRQKTTIVTELAHAISTGSAT